MRHTTVGQRFRFASRGLIVGLIAYGALSVQEAEAATITFRNDTGATVTLYFVDGQGVEDRYTEILDDEEYVQTGTSPGHVWRIKQDGSIIDEYVTGLQDRQTHVIANQVQPPAEVVLPTRSEDFGNAVGLTARNDTADRVSVYWVDFAGVEQPYGTVEPGGDWGIRTGQGHLWRFKIDGQTIQTYVATATANQRISIHMPGQLPGDAEYANWLAEDQPVLMPRPRRSSVGWIDGFKGVTLDIDTLSRRGYHLLRLNPSRLLDTGLRDNAPTVFERMPLDSKNWDVEAGFMMPNEFLYTPVNRTEGNRSTNLYFSESERTSSFAFNVGVSASQSKVPEGGDKSSGPKAGASYRQETTESAFSRSERASIMATRWGALFWISVRKDEIELDERFKQEALKLGDDYDAYRRFFETFGTHYPLSTLYGGLAYYEEFTDMDEIGKSLSKTTEASANATVPVKGVDVATEVGFSTTDQARTAAKTQKGEARFVMLGGTSGSNFEEWMLSETETRSLVPIKVDLRPVAELIWPAKFDAEDAAEARRILDLQEKMRAMLDRYLEEESRQAVQDASLRPRIFSVRIDSIRLVEDDDDGSGGPDLWGYVDLKAARYTPPKEHAAIAFPVLRTLSAVSRLLPNPLPNPQAFLHPEPFGDGSDTARKWANWKGSLRRTLDGGQATVTVPIGDFPSVDKTPSNISITPVITQVTRNGRTEYATDFRLSEYRFYPYGYLRDDDDHPFYPESSDDEATLEGRYNWFTLQDVVDAGGEKSATVSASAEGLGKVEVRYTVREVNYTLEARPMNLPDFPRF